MEYLIIIGLFIGGATASAFFVFKILKPIWKKEGRKEFLDEMRANNKKVSKKGKYGKMTDEQLDDYIDSITNNAQ